jgi:hypothetical protein
MRRGIQMATNLKIDDQLIAEAMKLGEHGTQREAVTAALEEYVKQQRRQAIPDLIGKVEYHEDYDYKALRKRKKRK